MRPRQLPKSAVSLRNAVARKTAAKTAQIAHLAAKTALNANLAARLSNWRCIKILYDSERNRSQPYRVSMSDIVLKKNNIFFYIWVFHIFAYDRNELENYQNFSRVLNHKKIR